MGGMDQWTMKQYSERGNSSKRSSQSGMHRETLTWLAALCRVKCLTKSTWCCSRNCWSLWRDGKPNKRCSMTPINRKLKRESLASVHSQGRRRSVIVELDPSTPGLIGFRLKGTRGTYFLPIDFCFREACRSEMARRKAERKRELAIQRKAR